MKLSKILKALSNEMRLQILEWLKKPEEMFPTNLCDGKKIGVCVGLIQQKLGLSQSTTSHYLSLLQNAGLIQATRMGKWTYYKRDEKAIQLLVKFLGKSL